VVLKLSTHITINMMSHCTSAGYAGDITLAFITMGKTCFQSNQQFEIPRDLASLKKAESSTLLFPIKQGVESATGSSGTEQRGLPIMQVCFALCGTDMLSLRPERIADETQRL
jgi:hypothetical protein